MVWRRTRTSSTRELLRAEHALHAPPRYVLLAWCALLLIGLLGGAWLWQNANRDDERARVHSLEQANAELQRQLEEARQQLTQGQLRETEGEAARGQLLKRIDDMSSDIKQLKTQLAFYRQQKKT